METFLHLYYDVNSFLWPWWKQLSTLFPFTRYRRIFFAIEENRRGGAGVAAGRLSWSKIVLLHLASSVF
jgi:hypothetical protein